VASKGSTVVRFKEEMDYNLWQRTVDCYMTDKAVKSTEVNKQLYNQLPELFRVDTQKPTPRLTTSYFLASAIFSASSVVLKQSFSVSFST